MCSKWYSAYVYVCVVWLQGTGPGTVLPEEDLKKYEAEFDEYGHKLDKAREEWVLASNESVCHNVSYNSS